MTAALDNSSIDRLTPTMRPDGRIVMRSGWHHLLFLHWPVEPQQLRPLLPPGLELDVYEGNAYVGLIPFTMTRVRPRWAPRLPHRFNYENFHEINVRTYVHKAGRDPGVWFFSLDAANALAVCAARTWFKLPYYHARMSLKISAEKNGGKSGALTDALTIEYNSQRLWPGPKPATCVVRYRPGGLAAPAAPGTLEHFLVERYILYSYARGRLYRGRVHHAPYPLQSAAVDMLQENLIAAAGLSHPAVAPLSHYAGGVDVEICPLAPAG